MVNKYYEKHRENLRKEARERYQNVSQDEKSKKRQYAPKQYRNLSVEEKEQKHQYGRE